MPSPQTVISWVLQDLGPGFAEQYARAREVGYQLMADELTEIADDGSNDWMVVEGREVPDHEYITRSRLRVDTRKWLLSKALPKIYGDKIAHEHSGTLTLEQLITQATVQAIEPPKPPEIPGRVIDVEDGE